MQDIDFPSTDMLGPKPAINTPELLAKQIGTLTIADLAKFTLRFPREHFIQACIRGEHGEEIKNSRLVALVKVDRDACELKYPETADADGYRQFGSKMNGNPLARQQAQIELQRLIDAKGRFGQE